MSHTEHRSGTPYTIKELAEAANVSDSLIRLAVKQGHIKTIRYGRSHRLTEEEFERVIAEGFPSVAH